MKYERKIMLPFYKVLYSILFIGFLALFRGISETREIGVTLDPAVSVLSIAFMADTYLIDKRERRWEIFALYPLKKKRRMVNRRILVQLLYLLFLSAMGYLFFLIIQTPSVGNWKNEWNLYAEYLFAVSISIFFWGVLSIVLSNLFQNIWCGIGISLLVWSLLNSTMGDTLLGPYNLFAYVFHNQAGGTLKEWIFGKLLGFVLSVLMLRIMIPQTLKRRRK